MKKLPQDSRTTVMLIWCLKQVKNFILEFLVNGSFCWGTQNHWIYYIQYCFFYFRLSCWWGVGEIAVNWANYQEYKFNVYFIQCQKSPDILRIVNEFVQFVQNYTFFYKQSIFDPRPENCWSFSKKLPPKNCLAIV